MFSLNLCRFVSIQILFGVMVLRVKKINILAKIIDFWVLKKALQSILIDFMQILNKFYTAKTIHFLD